MTSDKSLDNYIDIPYGTGGGIKSTIRPQASKLVLEMPDPFQNVLLKENRAHPALFSHLRPDNSDRFLKNAIGSDKNLNGDLPKGAGFNN